MYPENELAELFEGDNYRKIVSLHNRSKIGCNSYKQLCTMMGIGDIPVVGINDLADSPNREYNFYDTVNCRNIFVPEDNIPTIMEYIKQYIEVNHFSPFLELSRDLSNLVFVIETSIPYINNSYRCDESDVKTYLQTICKRIYKTMKVKTDSRIVIFTRSHKKKVYFKVHFLDYVMDIHNRVHLTRVAEKMISENSGDDLFTKVYPVRYNEFYGMSVLPMGAGPNHYYWDIYLVFDCRRKYSINIIETSKTSLIELTNLTGNSLAILSVNPYSTTYVKHSYVANVEKYVFNPAKQNDHIMLMKSINDQPRLAFVDMVLRHLPDEYKHNIDHCKNLLYSIKVIESVDCLDLFVRHHFTHLDEVTFNKYWYNNRKEIKLGYYANIAYKSSEFRNELQNLIEKIIEHNFYSSTGKISDSVYALILNFQFYGKYYYYEDNTGIKRQYCYMFVDRNDNESENKLYKWTLVNFSSPKLGYYLSEKLPQIMGKFIDSQDIKGSSYSKDEKIKALNQRKTRFINSKDKICDLTGQNNIMKMLFTQTVKSQLFSEKIDADSHVIGVLNGVLDLNFDGEPILHEGYSPYVVTKSCAAKYIPYSEVKRNGKYIKKIKELFRGVIPEKDARRKILYFKSTALDECADKNIILIEIGWGANGKSSTNDPLVSIFNDYGVKLSPTLLTEKRKGSAADPDFMQMCSRRFGLIAETNRGDTMVAARLKSATEKIKDGRGLYKDSENFKSQTTIVVSTNYPLQTEDFDYGTMRRLMVYRYIMRFVYNPDPANPHEKEIKPEYAKLFDNQNAKNELFSWLVHLRIKFHKLYNSDIHKVPSQTIDNYTNDYRCEQDLLTQFIYQRVIIMMGYNTDAKLISFEDKSKEELERDIDAKYELSEIHCSVEHKLSMEFIIDKYREWSKRIINKDITDGYINLLNIFKTSALAKFIIGDNDLAHVRGMRILEIGKIKLKDEMHIPFRK